MGRNQLVNAMSIPPKTDIDHLDILNKRISFDELTAWIGFSCLNTGFRIAYIFSSIIRWCVSKDCQDDKQKQEI